MYCCRSGYVEKILIDGERVEIQHLQKNNNASWRFPLHWMPVSLQSPKHHGYPNRLLHGSKGTWVEVRRCLTHEERITLAEAISSKVFRLTNNLTA